MKTIKETMISEKFWAWMVRGWMVLTGIFILASGYVIMWGDTRYMTRAQFTKFEADFKVEVTEKIVSAVNEVEDHLKNHENLTDVHMKFSEKQNYFYTRREAEDLKALVSDMNRKLDIVIEKLSEK